MKRASTSATGDNKGKDACLLERLRAKNSENLGQTDPSERNKADRSHLPDHTNSLFLQIIVNLRKMRKLQSGKSYDKQQDLDFESKMVDLINNFNRCMDM